MSVMRKTHYDIEERFPSNRKLIMVIVNKKKLDQVRISTN